MGPIRTFIQGLWLGLRRLFAFEGSTSLCDTCKWDYGDACRRPERPNATSCPDYKRK